MSFAAIYKRMLIFFYTLLILGYPMTSLLGLEYKIVTKELLDSKVSISECEYNFD